MPAADNRELLLYVPPVFQYFIYGFTYRYIRQKSMVQCVSSHLKKRLIFISFKTFFKRHRSVIAAGLKYFAGLGIIACADIEGACNTVFFLNLSQFHILLYTVVIAECKTFVAAFRKTHMQIVHQNHLKNVYPYCAAADILLISENHFSILCNKCQANLL